MRPPQFWRAGATLIILLVALCAHHLLTTAARITDDPQPPGVIMTRPQDADDALTEPTDRVQEFVDLMLAHVRRHNITLSSEDAAKIRRLLPPRTAPSPPATRPPQS